MELLDTFGRPLRDLRISVTDRCNFRCVYCMPKEVYGRDHAFLERRELLSFEEITRVAQVFVDRGVQKIRITGGEPLVRRDLERLIAQLAELGVDLTLTYCMPKEVYGRDHAFLERRELLTFEEIARVAGVFVASGVQKIRITGGEPLVRRDVERLIAQLSALDVDLTLTTNGSLLPQKAQLLADAGLRRITVSLDSLDDAQFRALNDVDFPVDRVLEGIDAATAAGLPVKVNAVIKRGANDDQIVPMARFFREQGHTLRFIEFMDVGHTNGWRLDDVVPASGDHRRAGRGIRRRAGRPGVPRRGRETVALQGRQRRGGRDRLRHPAVLRRLHSGPPLGRREALHLPVRRPRARPAGADSGRRHGRGARGGTGERVEFPQRPLFRASLRSDGILAEGGDELHRRLARPPAQGLEYEEMSTVVAAGRRHLPRGWADLGRQLAIWFGFAVLYQLARGFADRNPAKAFANGYHVVHLETTHREPALRADVPELRRPAAPARDRRLVDVLAVGVRGPRASRCSGSTCGGTSSSSRSATRSCSRT